MTKQYFTLAKAQRLARIIPEMLTDSQLQRHIVKLRDFKRYVDTGDYERLAKGGYYAMVIDTSASGFAPKDIWLQHNTGNALDEAVKEKQRRLNGDKQ